MTENSLAIKQQDNQLDIKIDLATVFVKHRLFRRTLVSLWSNAIVHRN